MGFQRGIRNGVRLAQSSKILAALIGLGQGQAESPTWSCDRPCPMEELIISVMLLGIRNSPTLHDSEAVFEVIQSCHNPSVFARD